MKIKIHFADIKKFSLLENTLYEHGAVFCKIASRKKVSKCFAVKINHNSFCEKKKQQQKHFQSFSQTKKR